LIKWQIYIQLIIWKLFSFIKVFSVIPIVIKLWAWLLSVRLSLVDYDDSVQQNWKSAHNSLGWCLDYLHAKVVLDHSILWFLLLLKKISGYGKYLESCTLVAGSASDGSHVVLSQHLLSFLFCTVNCIHVACCVFLFVTLCTFNVCLLAYLTEWQLNSLGKPNGKADRCRWSLREKDRDQRKSWKKQSKLSKFKCTVQY